MSAEVFGLVIGLAALAFSLAMSGFGYFLNKSQDLEKEIGRLKNATTA